MVRHGLLAVVAEVGREPLGPAVALGALQPDVEEIRQLGVLHVVLVGGIDDDGGHRPVVVAHQVRRRPLGDRDGRGLRGAREFGDVPPGVENVRRRPGQPGATAAGRHLGEGWLEPEVMAVKDAAQALIPNVPRSQDGIPVSELINDQGQEMGHRWAFAGLEGSCFLQQTELLHQHPRAQQLAGAEEPSPRCQTVHV